MQFLLPPWDRNRPRLQMPMAESLVMVGNKTFGLRAQNGLLFFRDRSDQVKTWTIATPLPPELESDVPGRAEFFRREFESGNIARYIVHLDSYIERTMPLFFRGDGTGWCRESWNRDDIPFSHSVTMHALLEGDDLAVQSGIDDVEEQLQQQLSNLGWPDFVNWSDTDEDIEWLCGSRDGLEEVLRWACSMEESLWKQRYAKSVNLEISTETPFSRAYVAHIAIGRGDKRDTFSLNSDMKNDTMSLGYSFGDNLMPSRRFWTLCDLALDENTPLGTYWEYHDYGMGRCADSPNPMWVSFKFDSPTLEEKSAVPAQLRAWLKGKVPSSEIETILADNSPGEFPKTEW